MKTIVTLIGLILIIEGMPYVALPEVMQEWFKQLAKAHPDRLRLMGLIALAVGLLLCFIARRTKLLG